MHREAREFVRETLEHLPARQRVVEVGSRIVNGSIRDLIRADWYVGIDLVPGPGVDIVADATTWRPRVTVDTVIAAEVLEHAEEPRDLIQNMHAMLEPGGCLILTAAGENREPHGADGNVLTSGEAYQSVSEADLRAWLPSSMQANVQTNAAHGDIYCVAVRTEPPQACEQIGRMLMIWPSAEIATFDLARGIHKPLQAAGWQVDDFRLYRRLEILGRGLGSYAGVGIVLDAGQASLYACEAIAHKAIVQHADWALFVSGLQVHPDSLWALRKLGVKIALWFTEAPYAAQDEDHAELYLARFVDVAFTNERTSVPAFQRVLDRAGNGGRAVYLPHAFDPDRHTAITETLPEQYGSDVLFIGTGFDERRVLFEAIDWAGINLRLGGVWPGLRPDSPLRPYLTVGAMPNRELMRYYHGTKIVLNPHRTGYDAESANPRTYEAAASVCFQIADYRAEIAEVFGNAIPTYQPGDAGALAGLIRHYLAHPDERQACAVEARRRVQSHTYQARAELITAVLGQHACEREHQRTA